MLKFLISVGLILFYLSSLGSADDSKSDLAWETYIQSQRKFQIALHDLIGLNGPHLKPVLEKSQELQLALADKRSAQFYFLSGKYAERIMRNGTFSDFINFTWTEKDQEELLKESSEFKKLQRRIENLANELDRDPLYHEAEDLLNQLEGKPEYTAIMARFRFIDEEVEKILSSSRGGEESEPQTAIQSE